MKLLHIDSSILGSNSVSMMLSKEIVEVQKQKHPGIEVIYRDLAAAPLGHLTGLHLGAMRSDTMEIPAELQADVAAGKTALEEFIAADILVIGAPMYNFSVSSQLKAWIDRICVAGKTFNYSSTGPVSLVSNKKVIIAASRGGLYSTGSPLASFDHQETYLQTLFQKFFAIQDFTIINAEGLGMSDHRAKSVEDAKAAITKLA